MCQHHHAALRPILKAAAARAPNSIPVQGEFADRSPGMPHPRFSGEYTHIALRLARRPPSTMARGHHTRMSAGPHSGYPPHLRMIREPWAESNGPGVARHEKEACRRRSRLLLLRTTFGARCLAIGSRLLPPGVPGSGHTLLARPRSSSRVIARSPLATLPLLLEGSGRCLSHQYGGPVNLHRPVRDGKPTICRRPAYAGRPSGRSRTGSVLCWLANADST